MAELLRTHPLEAWSTALEGLPDTVGITAEPFVAMAVVRQWVAGWRPPI